MGAEMNLLKHNVEKGALNTNGKEEVNRNHSAVSA
jgi:hypothetical protein